MIRNLAVISSVGLVICAGVVQFSAADDETKKPASKTETKQESREDKKATNAAKPNAADKTSGKEDRHDPMEDHDRADLRKTSESYVDAFSKGDVKGLMAHFTDKAEYVDPQGNVYHGKQEIESLLTAFFEAHPKPRLELDMGDTRMIGDGLAAEEGSSIIRFGDDKESLACEYIALHQKVNGKWLTASVRERTVETTPTHSVQLQQMNWMLGEWVHEGDDEVVVFSCESSDNGNFLIRKFAVQVTGHDVIHGTQRIGWDARSGELRTWIFDSEGGYGEGNWERSGNDWILKLTGVTKDGQSASCTSIYSPIDANTMLFQSVDYEIGGIAIPDGEPVTIVRQSPKPE